MPTFTRDDGREIDITIKEWHAPETDVGLMHWWFEEYEIDDPDEPPLTEAEEKRFFETATPPEPDEDYWYSP